MAGEALQIRLPHDRVGPPVLRVRAKAPRRPPAMDPAPPKNTEFFFPMYPMSGRARRVGPSALRGMRRTYSHGWENSFVITGVTKDATGAPLPGVTLHFFQVGAPFAYLGSATSDGSGVYSFPMNHTDATSADAYLIGVDVAGRSINGLVITRS